MSRDNRLDPKGQSDYAMLKEEVKQLKTELIRFKKNYEDAISNIDIDNISISLISELVKQVKKSMFFIDSDGNQLFAIKKDSDGEIAIVLNGMSLGSVKTDNSIFKVNGTWDFSKAIKIEND